MPGIGPGFEDILTGWVYSATLQLRTPLYVLDLDGHRVPAGPGNPPVLTHEQWHGVWMPETGEEFSFLDAGATRSSEVGYVPRDGGDYLVFLKRVRSISEGAASTEAKEKALRLLL